MFSGIEINESPLDYRIIVTQVEEGSEARKMGVLVEDEIIEVNGKVIQRTDSNTNFREITQLFISMSLAYVSNVYFLSLE